MSDAEPHGTAAGQDIGCGCAVRRRAWGPRLSLASSVVMVALPKCPLCWLGYTSLLSAASLWRLSGHYATWVPPLTLVSLGLVLAAIGVRGRRRAGPLFLGLAGAAAVAVAKLQVHSFPLAGAGFCLLLGAFVWSGRASPAFSLTRKESPT